jgi:hypothetical protein
MSKNRGASKMKIPLLPRPSATDITALEDLFLCMAATIEDSLLQAGAEPGIDYSRLDLYKLAQPFVLHTYKQPKADVAFVASWPKHDE